MIMKKLLLIFLIIFPLTLVYLSKGFAHAQIDLPDDDDSEADIEDQTEPENAVVGKDDLIEDDESDEKPLKASPHAETAFLFTKPTGLGLENCGLWILDCISGKELIGIKMLSTARDPLLRELPAGKDVHFLVGFANRGSKDFIVEAMDASFRYPLDFTFHIQNFSAIPYNRVVKPKQDISLYYAFYTSETYSSRPFGLVVNLYYKDNEGHQYLDAVFNETVTIVEIDESLDGETFFLYVLLAACAVLILVVAQQFLVSFTKKKISTGHKIETGTLNHQNDVDYDWLPKETINEIHKSPRRSERLSPRKSKQAQSKNAQVSPKQSPKEQTSRRAKRGSGVKDE